LTAAAAVVSAQIALPRIAAHILCATPVHGCQTQPAVAACCCDASTESARAIGPTVPVFRVTSPPIAFLGTVATLPPRPAPVMRVGSYTPLPPVDIPVLLANLRL
jgi:hypothetical protein